MVSQSIAKTAPQKSYRQILAEEIDQGLGELNRSTSGLIISGLSAGLEVGFSLFLMALMLSLTGESMPATVSELLMSNAYTIGFIFVILGRSELFTEHTTLAVLPVLSGRTTLLSLLRLWLLVYLGNLVGVTLFTLLAVYVGPGLEVIQPWAFGEIAHQMIDHDWRTTVLGAVLAGWLMGLLSWLVTAGRDTISQMAIIWLVTATIGIAHLPHCIVGTAEVLAGLFSDQGVTLADYGRFLLWATLGNIVGGVVFVAGIKYSHVTRGERPDQDRYRKYL